MESLEPCDYGHWLRRILHSVHFMHLQHPLSLVLISKADLDSAYQRVYDIWDFAVQRICITRNLAFLLL